MIIYHKTADIINNQYPKKHLRTSQKKQTSVIIVTELISS